MTSSGSHRRTTRTRVARRRRGLRLLAVVGAVVTMSSFMQPLTVGAIQPAAPETPEPPTTPPVEEPTTTAAPAPTEVTTTAAPATTSAEPSTTTPVEPTTSFPIPTTVPETSVPESSTTTSSTTTTVVPVVDITLTSLCTSVEDFEAGTRTFRVDNNSGQAVEITLQNVESGGSVNGTAPPGQSMWDVPAGGGANTTSLIVDGQTVVTADSTNLVCAVLDGNAQCGPAEGQTTVTWTVSSNDSSAIVITGDARGLSFTPGTVAPYGTSSATEVIDGQEADQEITETVTVQLGDGSTSELSDGVVVAACEGPPVPPEVTFTFTKSASAAVARVGDTVEYTYCGQNTSDIPLEVVRLVDDRLGVVIELPDVQTVVAPGETLCNTDVGQPVTYTVTEADLDTTIINSAVVTVRTLEDTPREFQAVAVTRVAVPLPGLLVSLLAGEDGRSWVCHATGSHYNQQEVSTSSLGEGSWSQRRRPPGRPGHRPARSVGSRRAQLEPGQRGDLAQRVRRRHGGAGEPDGDAGDVQRWGRDDADGGAGDASARGALHAVAGRSLRREPDDDGDGDGDADIRLRVGADAGRVGRRRTRRRRRYTVTLRAAACGVYTPVDPTVTQASCAAGILKPSLVLPTTDGITYTANPPGPYRAGDDGDGDGDVDCSGRGVAGDAAAGVDADVEHGGDVPGGLRRLGVYAGGSGGADGDAGDVCQRCRHRADD